MTTQFERPPTLNEAALTELRKRLLDGRLQPGERIRPDALGEELGISRVPVAEALKRLEGEGHVIYRAHRGYYVTELDLDDLFEVYRIRELLENEAVRVAVPQRTTPDLEGRLRDCLQEMEAVSSSDVSELTALNRRFHFDLIEAAAMPHLQNHLRILWDASEPYRALYYTAPERREAVHREHEEILEAVRDGDAERVMSAWKTHRDNAKSALKSILDGTGRSDPPA